MSFQISNSSNSSNSFKSFQFFKLIKNEKKPISKLSNRQFYEYDKINKNHFNVGLECAKNNLIVLDIDIKDDGLNEFKNYITKYGEPLTLIQRTPSGGFHYIFKISDDEPDEQLLKNKTKYRGKGLDIRKGTGFIACAPSSINGKKYKIKNDIEPQKMPLTLLTWLLEFENLNANGSLIYWPKCPPLNVVLELLQTTTPGLNWFKMTSALKNLYLSPYNTYTDEDKKTLFKMWNTWSKGDPLKYNKMNNLKIWNELKEPKININYFLNKEKKLKQACAIPKTTRKPDLIINSPFLTNRLNEQTNADLLNDHLGADVLIKSTTGTGKTSLINAYIKKLQDVEGVDNFKFISLVHLISMADQQKESLKDIKNLKHYKEEHDREDSNLILCINSLLKYSAYEPEFFNNYIVYIDEITSVLKALTHSQLLDKTLKPVYTVFNRIINNCRQVIATDAQILENSFILLENRTKPFYFIQNDFKKWGTVSAYHIKDENKFLNLMKEQAKQNEIFFFGCDSKRKTEFYFNSINEISKNNFLYTATEKEIKLNEMKNSRLFYSPSIVTGVDIVPASPQNVYLYINGQSLDPLDSFQQLTRNRNINKIYFFINESKSNYMSKYDSLTDTAEKVKAEENKHPDLFSMCYDETFNKLNENGFYKLFMHQEFINEILKTNKELIFKSLLDLNGIKTTTKGTDQKLISKKEKAKVEIIEEARKVEKVEKIIKSTDPAPESVEKILKILKITKEGINTPLIKKLIIDPISFSNYLNLYRLTLNSETIEKKLKGLSQDLTQYKTIYHYYYKIDLLFKLEKELNLTRFKLDDLTKFSDEPKEINKELVKRINSAFKSEDEPTTHNEYIAYYIAKIKHFIGDLKIVKGSQQGKRIEGKLKKRTLYLIDETIFNDYLKIINNMSINKFKFENKELTIINEESKETESNPDFIDDEYYKLPDPEGLDYGLY